jgi:PleD family two-component response regulator
VAIAVAGTPTFTVSIGLDDMEGRGDLQERVAAADAALIQAKTAGRDRIVVVERGPVDLDAA